MRKLFFFSLSLLAGICAQAQLSENFSSVGTLNSVPVGSGTWMVGGLPTGWTQYNGDGLTPFSDFTSAFGTNAWITRELTYANGTKDTVAVSVSYYAPVGVANDWLISPSFTPASNTFLLFDALAADGNYPDGFQVKISTTGAAPANFTAPAALSVTAASSSAWSTYAVNLSAYAGQSIHVAIINNSNDMFLLYLNNIRATSLPANDLALEDMTPREASHRSYAPVGSAIAVQGLVKNVGSSTVTGYTVKINDGTGIQSFPQTANMLPYTTSIFSVNYPMASAGTKPISMWVELTGDTNSGNDSLFSAFGGAAFTPTHNVIYEEATGTWCGWCPRGTVFMDSMHVAYPNDIYIAVHNADPMAVTVYDDGLTSLPGFSGFPSVAVGRTQIIDPSDMFTTYAANKAQFGVADITVGQPTISGNTMTVKADVKMAVSTKANYDYRLALVITKDDEHGTTSQWAQANYYSGSAAPTLVGAGFNWDVEANPVPAAKMYYDFVAKDIVGGFNGASGSLPATMTAGQTYSHTFNWTIPAGMELQKTRANVLLICGLNGEAQNGAWKGVYPTSVNDVIRTTSFNVYPNPAADYLNVSFDLLKTSDVTVTVTDMTGKPVYTRTLTQLTGEQGLSIATNSLANGLYQVNLVTNEGMRSQKIAIVH
jgi:hypothetical protein